MLGTPINQSGASTLFEVYSDYIQIWVTKSDKGNYKGRQVGGLQSATRVGYKLRWVVDYKVR